MKRYIEEDARGPASAQKHLRGLARSIPSQTASSRKGEEGQQILSTLEVSGEEGGLLEFQDVTDYGNRYAEKTTFHSLVITRLVHHSTRSIFIITIST